MLRSENQQREDFKTRALIYSSSAVYADFIQQILSFHGKEVDWSHDISKNADSDFLVLRTSNAAEASDFKPTIVLLSSYILTENPVLVLNAITPGGVLVYPETLENTIVNSTVYFRKLPYSPTAAKENAGLKYLITHLGDIPVSDLNDHILIDLDGIRLFCAQFGVMEEEFYESLAELLLN